jgi:hypothetical protein
MQTKTMGELLQGLIQLGQERQGIRFAQPFESKFTTLLKRGQQVYTFHLDSKAALVQISFQENQKLGEVLVAYPATYVNGNWMGLYLLIDQAQGSKRVHISDLAEVLNTPGRSFYRLQIPIETLMELDQIRELPTNQDKINQCLALFKPDGPSTTTIPFDPFKL